MLRYSYYILCHVVVMTKALSEASLHVPAVTEDKYCAIVQVSDIPNVHSLLSISSCTAIPSIINPLNFTQGPSSLTLYCMSTNSVATTVTFKWGNSTVGPLRDGESMERDGITYQLTQTVTDRAQSTYRNVLVINQSLADIIGPITFTCSVENTIGTSPTSQPLTIIGELLFVQAMKAKTVLCLLVIVMYLWSQED